MANRAIREAEPLTPGDVALLWREATKLEPYPTDAQNDAMMWHLNAYLAANIVPDRQSVTDARECFRAALKWCRHDFGARDSRVVELEAALLAVLDESPSNGIPALPSVAPRETVWRYPALNIWRAMAYQLRQMKREAGTSPNAVAVQFIAAALRRLGYEGVTAGMVSSELRKSGMQDSHGAETAPPNLQS